MNLNISIKFDMPRVTFIQPGQFPMYVRIVFFTSLALLSSVAGAADLAELRVYPPEVSLKTSKDRQSVVVQAVYADGITRDVTEDAQWTFADEKIAQRGATGGDAPAGVSNVVQPTGDGQTELTVAFEGQSVKVPVSVSVAQSPRPVSFKLDVMPIFLKMGCNSGSCHGAARGKDGFRLSLFGFDPDGDLFRITRELPGRRIDLAVPAASLIVEKSIGAVPHTGGKLFEADSPPYRDLVEWIASGVPSDPPDVATCDSLEIYPPQAVMDGAGATQRVTVLRDYSDGSDARRHIARSAPVQQLGQRRHFSRWDRHRRFARRSLRHGPVLHTHRGVAIHRAASGSGIRRESRRGGELHRRACREQAEEAAHPSVGRC